MRVIVIGAGFAGMAAACRLAGDGHTVMVVEKAQCLGGRAASERDGQTLDHGQHVLSRACGAAQGFLERIGALDAVSFQESLAVPLLSVGQRWVLRAWPLPGPMHLVPGLLGYKPLLPKERLAAVRAWLALWATRSTHDEAFAAWLARHGQTERANRLLWDPIVMATLNVPSSVASLLAARRVFRDALFVPHGVDLGCFTVPLGEVFDAARRYLEARGGTVDTGTSVASFTLHEGRGANGVRLKDGRQIGADAVISAVLPDALAALAAEIPKLAETVRAAQELAWSPMVNVHLTFDRDVLGESFAVGVDSPVQWILANGKKLSLPLRFASDVVDLADDEIIGRLHQSLRGLLPAAREGRLANSHVVRHRRATFIPSPGSDTLRPKARTAIPGFYVAGDWTATGWPSSIESAVRSGVYAAAALERDAQGLSRDDRAAERAEER